mgnify:FL=1
MQTFFESLWVQIPEIYLPKDWVDLTKWSVVACDQYTSQPDYRDWVKNFVWDAPSTYKLTFPEIYLNDPDKEDRIVKINQNMRDYLDQWILENKWVWFIYLDRQTSQVRSRKWLIMALDLERYDFSKWSQTLIRATEWTIIERIPPRMRIRENALFELPHILVLIDDQKKQVIEPLANRTDKFKKLYDFDMMMDWWHITWYQVTDEESINWIIAWLTALADKEAFKEKYWVGDDLWVLLFAMWDGNHSFATAKAVWETKKKELSEEERKNHPARFAIVEIENVHDNWINFEPIHRVLFNVDHEHLYNEMVKYFRNIWSDVEIQHFGSKEELKENLQESSREEHFFWWANSDWYDIIWIKNPKLNLEVGNLQAFLDEYLKNNHDVTIDYVHWEDVVEELWRKKWNQWFMLPIMDKSDFFKTVVLDWALPRKTFSMWEAEEKRFYLEARKIVK